MFTLFIANIYLDEPLSQLAEVLMKPENINLSRFLQFIGTFFFMAVPALLFGIITRKKPFTYMGFKLAPSGKQVFLVIGIVFAALFVSGTLGEINQLIPVSKDLTAYFKGLEEEYNKQVIALTSMKTTGDYLLGLVILAFLPALFEEMFFRGCLQQVTTQVTRSALAGIIITSVFFSIIHLSFYGFLPRLFLGIMLGYIFYFSGSLWLAIAAHFLNNAFAVTQMYALSRAGKLTPDMLDESFPLYYGLIALVFLVFVFKIFKRESEVVTSMYNLKRYARGDYDEPTNSPGE